MILRNYKRFNIAIHDQTWCTDWRLLYRIAILIEKLTSKIDAINITVPVKPNEDIFPWQPTYIEKIKGTIVTF